jgi:hypothetical protein
MKCGSLFFAILSSGIAAQEPLRIVALDGDIGHGVPEVIERMLGADAMVKAAFLRGEDWAGELSADMYLDGGSIGAPLTKDLQFVPVATPTHPALLEGSFTIPPPDTSKPVAQIIVINASKNGGNRSRVAAFRLQWASTTAAQAALKALPKLQVFGSVPGLREQLRLWHIPFDDLGAEMPLSIDPQTSALGDAAADGSQTPALSERSSLLLLRTQPASMTGVLCKDADGRRLTLVTLPHTADWRRSPLLYRILIQHLTPIP